MIVVEILPNNMLHIVYRPLFDLASIYAFLEAPPNAISATNTRETSCALPIA